jgi:hypothetical protein
MAGERIRQEHVPGPVPLGNLPPQAHPAPRSAVGEEDVAHVEADDFGKPEPRAQRQREDQVIPRMAGSGPPQAPLLGFAQGLGGEVGHGGPRRHKEAILAGRTSTLHAPPVAALEHSCLGSSLLRGLLN